MSHGLPRGSRVALDVMDTPARSPAPSMALPTPEENRAEAMRLYFEGSPEIFEPYRKACLAQFPTDLEEGEKASQTGDLQALRRVSHSLKSVLLTLGYPGLSDIAKECESLSDGGKLDVARQHWGILATQLRWIVSQG